MRAKFVYAEWLMDGLFSVFLRWEDTRMCGITLSKEGEISLYRNLDYDSRGLRKYEADSPHWWVTTCDKPESWVRMEQSDQTEVGKYLSGPFRELDQFVVPEPEPAD
jgi:hypothetical protein